MKTSTEAYAEIHYELEYSIPGANDWFADGRKHYNLGAARLDKHMRLVQKLSGNGPVLDYRVVRKTVTVEPVAEGETK